MQELEPYDVAQYWNEIRQTLSEIEQTPGIADNEAYAYFLENITRNLSALLDQMVQLDQMLTSIAETARAMRDSLHTSKDDDGSTP